MAETIKTTIDVLLSKSGEPHFWFDIDGTLKHAQSTPYEQKFNPSLVSRLVGLQEVGSTGAATSQSPYELASFLEKMQQYLPPGKTVFTGPSVLEDGHVWVPTGVIGQEVKILTSPQAIEQMQQLITEFVGLWQSIAGDEGWGLLPGLEVPLALATGKYQGVGSVSIWEKGPDMSDPAYKGEYEQVMAWIKHKAGKMGLTHLNFMEAGNGTLRVVESGKSKASLIQFLADQGKVNLGSCVYFGDGLNDLEPAALIRAHGGLVVAVANAHPKLKQLSNIVTEAEASDGVSEIINEFLEG